MEAFRTGNIVAGNAVRYARQPARDTFRVHTMEAFRAAPILTEVNAHGYASLPDRRAHAAVAFGAGNIVAHERRRAFPVNAVVVYIAGNIVAGIVTVQYAGHPPGD
jgi:hypothetical protein